MSLKVSKAMFTPDFLYDFGISQDDPASELKALELKPGNRVLCIASGGEVPLDFLINSDETIEIDAVDISKAQLYLSNLKLQSACVLETKAAAQFLGYMSAGQLARREWFNQIIKLLPEEEARFWANHQKIFVSGPIHYGRYESYIAQFAPFGRLLLGGSNKLLGLFDCKDTDQQIEYFDKVLKTRLLKILFKMIFHPRIYRKRAIAEQGLIHMGEQNIGIRFFHKFKSFCTHTPARENWYLQLMLFNQVLFDEALPTFLKAADQEKLRSSRRRLRLLNTSFTDAIEEAPFGYYNKFAFSNITDWLTEVEVVYLMELIEKKSGQNANGLIRYIHSSGIKPQTLKICIKLNPETDAQLMQDDRFPFYNLISFKIAGI